MWLLERSVCGEEELGIEELRLLQTQMQSATRRPRSACAAATQTRDPEACAAASSTSHWYPQCPEAGAAEGVCLRALQHHSLPAQHSAVLSY